MEASAFPNSVQLAVEGVAVHFDGLAALSGVKLAIHRREVFGLIGPNGAGKTTLVNCLSGFQRPSAGRVLLDGHDASGWQPDFFRRAGVARTFQAGRLFKDMTVLDNVEVTAVSLGLSRRAAKALAMKVLGWIDLADKAQLLASALAYADQQLVAIARALVVTPAFLLLDEPTAGMSDSECAHLMALIRSIPATFGCGVLLIEHNMRVVMGISDRIHVLDGGRTIAEDTPDKIQQHEGFVAAYLGIEE
ncbi:branched-chain amino acid transport system ATP-binding protein [Nitrobacteraceae bacterium AZCC 2161]